MRLLLVIGTFVAFGIALASLRSRAQELSTVERVDRLVVNKSEHSMEAYDQGRVVAQYRVAVGGGRLGPKLYEGDRRTPEGRYRIDGRHRSRHFHRFLHVSYPTVTTVGAIERPDDTGPYPPIAVSAARLGFTAHPSAVCPRWRRT